MILFTLEKQPRLPKIDYPRFWLAISFLLIWLLPACAPIAGEGIIQLTSEPKSTATEIMALPSPSPAIEASPSQPMTSTVEVKPWVDLPVNADVIKKDSWIAPGGLEVSSSKYTKFFGVVESNDGKRFMIWAPYEVNPDDYKSADMYWVENGRDDSGETTLDATLIAANNYILNMYYNNTGDFDGILIGDWDVAKYVGDGHYIYPDPNAFIEGKVGQTLKSLLDAISQPCIVIVFDIGKVVLFNEISELPPAFLDTHSEWWYFVLPLSVGTDNKYDIFNAKSRVLGKFQYDDGKWTYVPGDGTIDVTNLVNTSSIGK